MATLFLMIGLPYSGKSTLAESYKNYNRTMVISSDEIRKELFGDAGDQSNNELVFKEFHTRVVNGLKMGYNVFADATNLNRKKRMAFLGSMPKGTFKVGVMMATPLELIFERMEKRERRVSKEVVMRMLKQFQPPTEGEGFDLINIELNRPFHSLENYLELNLIPHDNPHHKLDVAEHMLATSNLIKEWLEGDSYDKRKNNLMTAARYHDIGKYLVKEFDDKGIAHYYYHANVSAYLYLTAERFSRQEDVIYRANLIYEHMTPFNSNFPPKRMSIYPKEFIEDLLLLHKADVQSA